MKNVFLILGAPLLLATVVLAGPPQIENAVFESAHLDGFLSSRVMAWSETVREPSWMGWHVPMVRGGGRLCCWTRGNHQPQSQACNLESTHRHFVFSSDRSEVSMDSETLVVLLRADSGRLEEMRIYSDGCRLDAGGTPVIWLEGVEPEESVGLLNQWIEGGSVVKDEALMAMALHATPLAVDRLTGIVRQSSDAELRGEALFWLAHTGAAGAPDIILQALAADPDSAVREEAIFALSQLPDHQGLPLLLEILQDPSRPSEVREEAFFWYVQSGDDQALDLIAGILRN
jgi:hypothetical protein